MKKAPVPFSRYIPLTQQEYLCAPTCIQMILIKNKIPLIPAELIAHHLKVVVPKRSGALFWNILTATKKPASGWGTPDNEIVLMNAMFKSLKVPLHMTWKLIDIFTTENLFQKYIDTCIRDSKDVIVCFDYGTLFDTYFYFF